MKRCHYIESDFNQGVFGEGCACSTERPFMNQGVDTAKTPSSESPGSGVLDLLRVFCSIPEISTKTVVPALASAAGFHFPAVGLAPPAPNRVSRSVQAVVSLWTVRLPRVKARHRRLRFRALARTDSEKRLPLERLGGGALGREVVVAASGGDRVPGVERGIARTSTDTRGPSATSLQCGGCRDRRHLHGCLVHISAFHVQLQT